jgi:transposase
MRDPGVAAVLSAIIPGIGQFYNGRILAGILWLSFDAATYARRNVVERCVNRLKQWRGIATRYEKRAVNYRAAVVIASLMIWLAS